MVGAAAVYIIFLRLPVLRQPSVAPGLGNGLTGPNLNLRLLMTSRRIGLIPVVVTVVLIVGPACPNTVVYICLVLNALTVKPTRVPRTLCLCIANCPMKVLTSRAELLGRQLSFLMTRWLKHLLIVLNLLARSQIGHTRASSRPNGYYAMSALACYSNGPFRCGSSCSVGAMYRAMLSPDDMFKVAGYATVYSAGCRSLCEVVALSADYGD